MLGFESEAEIFVTMVEGRACTIVFVIIQASFNMALYYFVRYVMKGLIPSLSVLFCVRSFCEYLKLKLRL